jgi:hypothetical protein
MFASFDPADVSIVPEFAMLPTVSTSNIALSGPNVTRAMLKRLTGVAAPSATTAPVASAVNFNVLTFIGDLCQPWMRSTSVRGRYGRKAMSNYANRLDRLEDIIRPSTEKLHILYVIIDPLAPDSALSAIALGDDESRTCFTRGPGEGKAALCERARVPMGWGR